MIKTLPKYFAIKCVDPADPLWNKYIEWLKEKDINNDWSLNDFFVE